MRRPSRDLVYMWVEMGIQDLNSDINPSGKPSYFTSRAIKNMKNSSQLLIMHVKLRILMINEENTRKRLTIDNL